MVWGILEGPEGDVNFVAMSGCILYSAERGHCIGGGKPYIYIIRCNSGEGWLGYYGVLKEVCGFLRGALCVDDGCLEAFLNNVYAI